MPITSRTDIYRRHLLFAAIAFACSALLAAPCALAQDDDDELTTFGVLISPDHVMRSTKVFPNQRLQGERMRRLRLRDTKELVHVSLSALLAEAKAACESGKPIPDAVRTFGGMVKLRYIYVDAENNDLILAGPAEQLDMSDPNLPRGKATGRPALQLDDFVAAYRLLHSPRPPRVFGCSIDPPMDALDNLIAGINEYKRLPRERQMDLLVDKIGPQKIRFINIEGDTRFALAFLAADYRLKRLSLGLDTANVSQVRHTFARVEPKFNSWWFTIKDVPILNVSPDGTKYELAESPLQILTAGDLRKDPDSEGSPSAKRFAKAVTDHFEALSLQFPTFADIWNVTDLAILVTLIRKDRLDEKTDLDLAWLNDASTYKLRKFDPPKQAQTLINYRSRSFAAGGVQVRTSEAVDESHRETKEELEDKEPAKREVEGSYWGRDVFTEKPDPRLR